MDAKPLTGYLPVDFISPVYGQGSVPGLTDKEVEPAKDGQPAKTVKEIGETTQRTVIGHDVIGRGFQRVVDGNVIEVVNADGGQPPQHTEYRLADGMNFVSPLLPWMKDDTIKG